MQNPELFACLSKERKENLLGTLLFRPSIYERLYYEEEMVRKQIVCYEEFLQIVRNPQIRAAAPEIDFEFEEFSANSYLSLVDEYLYWNKVPGDILLRLKKAAEDALAYARENKNFRQNEETLLGTLHTIQGYLGEISISEMLDTYVNWLNGADPTQYDWMNVENNLLPVLYTFWLCEARPESNRHLPLIFARRPAQIIRIHQKFPRQGRLRMHAAFHKLHHELLHRARQRHSVPPLL